MSGEIGVRGESEGDRRLEWMETLGCWWVVVIVLLILLLLLGAEGSDC